MEQINQLKAMRDAARSRIEATPDYKLMTSLNALIVDLEKAFGAPAAADGQQQPVQQAGAGAAQPAGQASPARQEAGKSAAGIFNGNARKAQDTEEDAIDQAVAELEAELISSGASEERD